MGEKLPVDIKQDDANNPRAVALRTCGVVVSHVPEASLVPRLLPYRKTGREPGRTDHVPSDVLCVVLCVVLMIELLPTRSVVVCR